jgi:putative aldouronate transport system permease protein
MVRYLDLKNSYIALLLPLMLSAFNIILMKSYLSGIPKALTEAAKIDGAGDFEIFWKIILPLSKPALATVGLFIAIGYWNDWYNCMLFINNENLYSLQYYLYKIVNNVEAYKLIVAQAGGAVGAAIDLPSESLKMALTVIVTGPILLLYPFIQKYFVSGVTIGAVKE